jgi:Carboxypeptidase regulatory-like domain
LQEVASCGFSSRTVVLFLGVAIYSAAQSAGSAGSIAGAVVDPTGAVVNATVEIRNLVSHYDQSTKTDGKGNFGFTNVPSNPYYMAVSAGAFAATVQDVDIRSEVPVNLKVTLQVTGSRETVTVEANRVNTGLGSSHSLFGEPLCV